MRIVDTFGNSLPVPFVLGQPGKRRKAIEVLANPKVICKKPEDFDVEYHIFEKNPKVIYLCESTGRQKGVLVRINTRDLLPDTSHAVSQVKKISGKATRLATAPHIVGRSKITGIFMDELWHVAGPCIFCIKVREAGKNRRTHEYISVSPDGFSHYSPTEQSATNFEPRWWTLEQAAIRLGVTVPEQIIRELTGVNGIEDGTLTPGNKKVVILEHGPAGGWRYKFEIYKEEGLTRLAQDNGVSQTRQLALALIEKPDWYSASINYKDDIPIEYVLINESGNHFYTPDGVIRSESWQRRQSIKPSIEDFAKLFDLGG